MTPKNFIGYFFCAVKVHENFKKTALLLKKKKKERKKNKNK